MAGQAEGAERRQNFLRELHELTRIFLTQRREVAKAQREARQILTTENAENAKKRPNDMKRGMIFALGLMWFGFALGFGFLLVQYVAQGAGYQFFAPIAFSGSVLLGLVHFVGLCTAVLICFALGCGLCARAVVARDGR
jgi:hypothetical protein